jgi:hypothetical protein
MIHAAGIDTGLSQNRRDASGVIALLVEELESGFQQPFASFWLGLNNHSTILSDRSTDVKLGRATRRGECCAWIDTEGVFDPASVAEAGVELDRVLWVNCAGNAQHALKSTDLLIQAGGLASWCWTWATRRMPWRVLWRGGARFLCAAEPNSGQIRIGSRRHGNQKERPPGMNPAASQSKLND